MSNDTMLETAVDQITELLRAQIGLRPEPTLRGRLRRAVRDEASAYEQDLPTYLATVASHRDALQKLLNRITVQETSFFRHPEHFEILAREVLPTLPRPTRVWSAGCAHGQEAYSIAMVMEEQGVAGSVIATDLSTAALHRTTEARYTAREMTGLSPERTGRHLTRVGKDWQVNAAIRDRVTTLRHNLIDALPDQARYCHVVFCRNVLIYFTPEHARIFLDQVADALPRNGVLFLGSAEAIWPVSERFDTVRTGDTFLYRPRPNTTVPSTVPLTTPTRDDSSAPRTSDRTNRASRRSQVPTAQRARAATPPRELPVTPSQLNTKADATDATRQLAETGQRALEARDYQPAIIAFRKWAYLAPKDAIAHLHLGLALESAGDKTAARRAYGAAHRMLLSSAPNSLDHAIDGYAAEELMRLLETKTQDVTK
jgi:chemotaxis protein methyltransferase CheR